MAGKGMNFITPDGEILQDVTVRLDKKYYSSNANLRIAASPTNLEVTKKDFRIYTIPPDREPKTNKFGDLIDLRSSRVFSKMFQSEDPNFSKNIYYKFWYKLCIRVDIDTNIVFARKPKRHYVTIIKEIKDICTGSKNTVYRFLKECKEKNLIRRFSYKDDNLFVLNPLYVLNGHEIPLSIYSLFNKKLEDYNQLGSDKEEE